MSFHASDVAHELVGALHPVWERLRTRNPKLADELMRSMISVPLNTDEGRRRQGRDRIHFWNTAAGSAGEIRSILRIAVSLRYESPETLKHPLGLLDRAQAMLYRMTHGRASVRSMSAINFGSSSM